MYSKQKSVQLFILLCCCGLSATVSGDQITCKDRLGNAVEWFVVYKAPKTANNSTRKQGTYEIRGTEYGYIDSKSDKTQHTFDDGIEGIYTDKKNPLAFSLEKLFDERKDSVDKELTYIVYNDQPPPSLSNSTSNGHTKGIVLFGEKTGLYIVHSVPKFPDKLFSGKYSFPSNARENGQSFLCITLGVDQLDTIVSHLLAQNPNMYAINAPSSMRERHPGLELLLNKKFPRDKPLILDDVLTGIDGTKFRAFAKSGRFNKDVYSGAIAPALKVDLFVQSWRNGNGGKLPPDCTDKFQVTDVQKVALNVRRKTLRWSSNEDHSKWAVSHDNGFWTCIGSINRMSSQFKRGGETICLQSPTVQRLFVESIDASASCDSLKSRSRLPPANGRGDGGEQTENTSIKETTGKSSETTPKNDSKLKRFYDTQRKHIVDGLTKLFSLG